MTFGLSIARARDIPLSAGIELAAQELKKSKSLIGTALRLLTDDVYNQEALKTSLGTLTRVPMRSTGTRLAKTNRKLGFISMRIFLRSTIIRCASAPVKV